jgi:hypothetical protein
MGYTHYWYRPETLNAVTFRLFAEDVRQLLAHLPEHSSSAGGYFEDDPLVIRGWNGTEEPEITSSLVLFNGDREQDLEHESCYIPRIFEPQTWERPDPEHENMYFQFCKTARKPYDLLVTATLIRFKHHFPEVDIGSDGYAKDWIEGLKLCTAVFGSASLPFEEDD